MLRLVCSICTQTVTGEVMYCNAHAKLGQSPNSYGFTLDTQTQQWDHPTVSKKADTRISKKFQLFL